MAEVKGLSDLLATMQRLPGELVSKNGGPVRASLWKGVKIIRDEARARAPKKSGNLAKNIVARRDRDPRSNGASERYTIGVKHKRWTAKKKAKARRADGSIDYGDDPYYWRFPEFGTEKQKAEPYMRPAFEVKKQQALDAFVDSIGPGIQRAVQKAKR